MRPDERNPLDLNNLPEDHGRVDGGKQVLEDISSPATTEASSDTTTRFRKKKNGAKQDGTDEAGKVYECRFCSLKFCKSQALGGHMNRHRQERETETLNRARQLVFNNESIAAQGCPHLGLRDPNLNGGRSIPSVNFHQAAGGGDPSQPFRSVYPTRLFSGSSSTILTPPAAPPSPHQPYLYSSSSPSSRIMSFPSQYPPHHLMNDYVINGVSHESNYTCIGAPLGHVFPHEAGRSVLSLSGSGSRGGGDVSLQSTQEDHGLNWGPTYARVPQQHHVDPSINRFQDGF